MINKYQKVLNKCCVIYFNGNYNKQSKGRVLSLPSDKEEREKWMKIIPRENVPGTLNTFILARACFTRLSDSAFIWYKKS